MKIIKKKNINIFLFKKKTKLNKIYIKNLRIISEYYKINKFYIVLNHALTGSHHFNGIYIKNFKNKGWFNLIFKYIKLKTINIICLNNINSFFGSSSNKCFNPLNNLNYNKNFINIKIKNIIKIKLIIINKLKIKNLINIIGGSLGGVEIILWIILYPLTIKFYLIIASNLYLDFKNLILNKINKLICNYFLNFQNKFYIFKKKNFNNLKIVRIINYFSYLSKNEIKIKNKNNIPFKLKNYINYNSNNFIKNYNILNIIFFYKLYKNCKINIIKKKLLNIILISFVKDPRFKQFYFFKLLNKILKYQKTNYININSFYGHDGFLKIDKIYLNFLKLYFFNLIGAIGFEPMTI